MIRKIIAAIFFVIAVAHVVVPSKVILDWSTLALLGAAVALGFAHQFKEVLPFFESVEFGKAKFKLRQESEKLALAVGAAEDAEKVKADAKPIQPLDRSEGQLAVLVSKERLTDTSVETKILNIAAQDKLTAILALGVEIETEILLLSAMVGLRNVRRVAKVREAAQILNQFGYITDSTRETLSEFWRLRNKIAHAQYAFREDDPVLNSFLDNGLTLLHLIKSIPRPIYRVRRADVRLFKDEKCIEGIEDYVGVLLDVLNADGTKGLMILPAGRKFQDGEVVGWDWDPSKEFGRAYYIHPETNKPTLAWDGSLGFVGRNEDLRFRAAAGRP